MSTKKKITRKIKSLLRRKSSSIEDSNFVFDHLMLPLIYLDNHGKILRVNNSWLDLFGHIKKDCEGMHYFDFLGLLATQKMYPIEIAEKIRSVLQKAIGGNFKPKFLEFPMNAGWYLSHMHPIHRENKLQGFVITHHDVTIWKQKELELQRQSKETAESSQRKMFFLANLNHELKSPLNSILGFSQLLKEEFESNPGLEGYGSMIDNIVEATSHLKSIVFRILNMAKIESGTLTLQEERVMPARLIQLSLNILQPMYPNREIRIEITKEAAAETLKCDKNLAMEVLINLLVNSMKFSQTAVSIRCAIDNHKNLIFCVSDSGVGMTKDEINVALEPFGQNIRSPHDKETGLGLGVPFSSQIMKLHGGELQIQSEKGKGTKVTAVFPANRIVI